ncbi:LAFE_0E02828g1_1 [Lachancea fermentati]|uniref:LAFE_0E02828g1_1 n=1 Tax=Lachancea fermentati TaxID=4955 RepID=A0A1G4MCT2_LACFM|nr:LAFE_0E02828g1_1 [Lachancea fermentati]
MSIYRPVKVLLSHVAASLGLLGTRVRHANHYLRRTKNKNLDILALSILGLLLLGFITKNLQTPAERVFEKEYTVEEASDLDTALDHSKGDYIHSFPEPVKKALQNVIQHIIDNPIDGHLDKQKESECNTGKVAITDTSKFGQLTESSLKNCIQVSDEITAKLKASQTAFISKIRSDLTVKYDSIDGGAFHNEGIVMVGGGKFSLFALTALKAIRANSGVQTRNTAPIEIIFPSDDDDDKTFCESVLPVVDPSGLTKCIFLTDVFDRPSSSNMPAQQLKALALLVSSFEKILLLDADNYVINSLDDYFSHNELQERGLVLWPHFWRRVHHPKLYDIFNVGIDRSNVVRNCFDDVSPKYMFQKEKLDETPFHDFDHAIPDGCTETGQLLINKKKHLDTIILNLYLHYNGEAYFYPLLDQSVGLDGNQDTLTLAAHVLHGERSYYQIKAPIESMGYWLDSQTGSPLNDEELDSVTAKRFYRTAWLQHDLVNDWNFHATGNNIINDNVYEREITFCNQWLHDHNDSFAKADQAQQIDQCRKSDDFKKTFEYIMKTSYKLSDISSLYKYTPVTFVHSFSPQYDPWECSQREESIFHTTDPKDKTKNRSISIHYRMYDSKMSRLTNYDLELENWLIFKEVLCEYPDSYKKFSYLAKHIEATETPEESAISMCAYIRARVKYLQDTTWST